MCAVEGGDPRLDGHLDSGINPMEAQVAREYRITAYLRPGQMVELDAGMADLAVP